MNVETILHVCVLILFLHLCVSIKQYIVEDYFVFLHLHLWYHTMCMIAYHSAVLFIHRFHLWELSMLITYRSVLFILLLSSFLSYTLTCLLTFWCIFRLLQVFSLFWKCLHEYLSVGPFVAHVWELLWGLFLAGGWEVLVYPVLSERAVLIYPDTSVQESTFPPYSFKQALVFS